MRFPVHAVRFIHGRQLRQITQQISTLGINLKELLSNNRVVYLIIRFIIHSFNQKFYSFLTQIKKYKCNQLQPQKSNLQPTLVPQAPILVVSIPSNLPLSDDELSLLGKGLKSVLLQPCADQYTIRQNINRLDSSLRLLYLFRD